MFESLHSLPTHEETLHIHIVQVFHTAAIETEKKTER